VVVLPTSCSIRYTYILWWWSLLTPFYVYAYQNGRYGRTHYMRAFSVCAFTIKRLFCYLDRRQKNYCNNYWDLLKEIILLNIGHFLYNTHFFHHTQILYEWTIMLTFLYAITFTSILKWNDDALLLLLLKREEKNWKEIEQPLEEEKMYAYKRYECSSKSMLRIKFWAWLVSIIQHFIHSYA